MVISIMSNINISIVVPTLNSAETIRECLTSIRANVSKYRYEIIVCDAGSTDGTVSIANHYADRVLKGTVRRINRNIGIENADGQILCFTDSDCIVPNDWINKLVDGLLQLHEENDKTVGVGGGNIPFLCNPSLVEIAIAKVIRSPLVSFRARNMATYTNAREVSHNPPMNSACFKWILDEVGGFQEEPGYPEDLDIDARIVARGYRLYYIPDIVVLHKHKVSFAQFARQMRDFGRKRVRVNRAHKSIARYYHYGPLLLYVMIYSPLIFIPMVMAVANACYVSLKAMNMRLFLPVVRLTLSFYRNYGRGEFEALKGG